MSDGRHLYVNLCPLPFSLLYFQLSKGVAVWKLFCCPWDSVLVLYTNGTYSWKSSLSEVAGNDIDQAKHLWCDMQVTSKGDALVVMVFKKVCFILGLNCSMFLL